VYSDMLYVIVQVILASCATAILTPPGRRWTRLAHGSWEERSTQGCNRVV